MLGGQRGGRYARVEDIRSSPSWISCCGDGPRDEELDGAAVTAAAAAAELLLVNAEELQQQQRQQPEEEEGRGGGVAGLLVERCDGVDGGAAGWGSVGCFDAMPASVRPGTAPGAAMRRLAAAVDYSIVGLDTNLAVGRDRDSAVGMDTNSAVGLDTDSAVGRDTDSAVGRDVYSAVGPGADSAVGQHRASAVGMDTDSAVRMNLSEGVPEETHALFFDASGGVAVGDTAIGASSPVGSASPRAWASDSSSGGGDRRVEGGGVFSWRPLTGHGGGGGAWVPPGPVGSDMGGEFHDRGRGGVALAAADWLFLANAMSSEETQEGGL